MTPNLLVEPVVQGSRLDEVMPRFDVSKSHRLFVEAPPDLVFRAVEEQDMRGSGVTRLLMALRGYGRRVRRPVAGQGLAASLAGFGFVPLGGRPGRELVFGIAGKFWTPAGGLRDLTPAGFLAFADEGYAKGVWNLTVSPSGAGSNLATETRVLCFGAPARRRFKIYWRTIELFSGLIRMSMLRRIRDRALKERTRPAISSS